MRLRIGVIMLLSLCGLAILSACGNTAQVDYYHVPTKATPIASMSTQSYATSAQGTITIILPEVMDLTNATIQVPGPAVCPGLPTEITVNQGWYEYTPRSMANLDRLKLGHAQGKELIIRAHDSRYRWYTAEYGYDVYRIGPFRYSHQLFVITNQDNHAMVWESLLEFSGKESVRQVCL